MVKFLCLEAALLLAMAAEARSQACPAKLSERLCANFLIGQDSTLLKARISLDPTLWMPSKSGDGNPLVDSAKALLRKYRFHRIEDPDSIYWPEFMDGGSFGIDTYLKHNVLAPKERLDSVASETYVKTMDLGCGRAVSGGVCDAYNNSPDSAWIGVFIYFRAGLQEDTAAMEAYLARYDTRNPENPSERFSPEFIVRNPVRGLAVERAALEKMSLDPDVLHLAPWFKVTTKAESRLRPRSNAGIRKGPKVTVDGRAAGGRLHPRPETLFHRE